jgi:hypothetical protein
MSRGAWNKADLHELSLAAPAVSGGEQNSMLISADLATNDSVWRMLALLDPLQVDVEERYLFAVIYARLRELLIEEYKQLPDEAKEMASEIADYLIEARARIRGVRRGVISKETRETLLDSTSRIACWYCGNTFGENSIDAFLDSKSAMPLLPRYVDFVTQRGLSAADLRIEIDHIHPVAAGGGSDIDNLRLACGWCNRYKSALTGLYDSSSFPSSYLHPRVGELIVPAKYWVIRVLATRRRCEWSGGCGHKVEDHPLRVAPFRILGAMVPGNLMVVCSQHDPIADLRLVPNTALAKRG